MAEMYFIALVAPAEINNEVLKWKQWMKDKFGCAVALRSPAHITLVPPFWMKEDLENKLKDTIEKFSQQQYPFETVLKNFSVFKPRVIYVDVVMNESLKKLHSELQELLSSNNLFPIKKDDRAFHPHVTIAIRDLRKATFYEAWESFKEKKYEAEWPVTNISLLRHAQKKWDVIFTSHFQISPGI